MLLGTYLIVLAILLVKVTGSYMMSHVPRGVLEASIISVVLDDLVLCDLVSRLVFVVTISKSENVFHLLTTERCLAVVCGDRRPHVLENHHVLSRHFSLIF